MSFINSKLRYCVTCLIASSMLCALSDIFGQETLSLSVSGTPFELVWVPVDAPQGVKRVEIGDFSGKHPKEKKRSESIYAPFESNGKRGYYLGKTEVTEEQWASVVGQGPRSKLPVAGKTYTEIQLFIDKLNGMARSSGGMPRTPDGAEGFLKLPTEAEWEYAARGAEGASYADQDPYGGDLERYEVFSLPGSDSKAKEAASRPANALGLHDVLGNVRELMEGNYSVGGVAGGGLLLKGGSYLSENGEIRSSSRTEQQRLGKDGQPSRRPDAGIRLCLSAEIFTSLGSKVPELESVNDKDSASAEDITPAASSKTDGSGAGISNAVMGTGGNGVSYQAKLVNFSMQETEDGGLDPLEVGEVEVTTASGTRIIPNVATSLLPEFIPPKTLFCLAYENGEINRFIHYNLTTGRATVVPMPDDLDPYFGPPSLSPAGDKIAYISFDREGGAGYRIRAYPSLRLIKASAMRPLYGGDSPWSEPEWISNTMVRFDVEGLVEDSDKDEWRAVTISADGGMAPSFQGEFQQLESELVALKRTLSETPATPPEEEIPDPPSDGPDRTGYRKAAERGDADAQNNLGASYANGNGVPQNYALAVKWYGKSAKQNNSMAQKNLGVCYFNGQGVPQDFVEAYKWYAVAAANGEDIKAATYRDDAASRLSPAQLSKAQAEAAKLFEQLSKGR